MKVLDQFKLMGKVALVAGASRGLGRGMALALGEAGANISLVARTSRALEETAGMIEAAGSPAHRIPADLSQIGETERAVRETVDRFGRLDILVNSIGAQVRKPAVEMSEKDWEYLMGINLKAVYFLGQAAAKEMMKAKKGKIINITSLTSFIGIPNISIYGASKGGILTLTRHWAVEWARYNINVNAIGPGYFKTAMSAELFNDPEKLKWLHSRIPMGRTGLPEDLEGVVVFLASDASNYITGQVINVDGGWLSA